MEINYKHKIRDTCKFPWKYWKYFWVRINT